MSITIRDIIKPVPKFQDVDDAAMRQCFNDRNTHRDVEFFIRIERYKKFGRVCGGCNLYECHATLLNCNECLFRFKCFTEKKRFILKAKEDAGLVYLRDKWGMLWGQHLSFGCGGATVIEKYGWDCDSCDEGYWGACEAEKNT